MDLELNEAQVAFAEAILNCGLIELNDLQTWLDQLTEVPSDLGEALCQAGLLSEFELVSTLSKLLEIGKASDIELEMYAVPHPKIPRDVCVELLLVPLSEEVVNPFPIAMANPFDEVGLQYISELLDGSELKISLAPASLLRNEITACYGTEEEWQQYLAEQEKQLAEVLDELDPAILSDDNLDELCMEVESTAVAEQTLEPQKEVEARRPQFIPDWSHLCPHTETRIALLHQLLED